MPWAYVKQVIHAQAKNKKRGGTVEKKPYL
jgi:hypothetical protein